MNNTPPVIYLAPFQGITTLTYREVFVRHFRGVDKLYTPFYTQIPRSKAVASKIKELEITAQNRIQLVPQILSKDADEMLRFATHCHEKGHTEINWNMGCPFPRVANKQRGSGMLPHPDLVESILQKITPQLPLNLSVKCRLGYEDASEIDALIPIFNEHCICELTVHARLGKQMYSGEVNWSAIQKLLNNLKIPFAYNGDIFSVEDYQKFKITFPQINTLMIGRGLLTDPFLPAKLKGLELPDLSQQQVLVKRFVEDLYLSYRKFFNDRPQTIGVLKEFWSNLAFAFNNPGKVFGKIKKSQSFDAYESAVADVFNEYHWVGSEAQWLKNLAYNEINE